MKIVKKIVIVFCLLTFCPVVTNAHPFYVSICQVDYNKENQSLEVSVKIFADDLLVALEKAGATKIFLGEKKENPETDKFIFNYLKFKVNGKMLTTRLWEKRWRPMWFGRISKLTVFWS